MLELVKQSAPQIWEGLSGDGLAFALAQAYQAQPRCYVILTPDVGATYALADALSTFLPDVVIDIFPDWEILPYDHFSPHQEITSERIRLLRTLPQRSNGIVLVAMGTLLHRLAPKSYMVQPAEAFAIGDTFSPEKQLAYWLTQGYQRVSQVRMPGELALRGGIFDIFTMGSAQPIRIELFGDIIESLRTFDPESQCSTQNAPLVEVVPAKEFPANSDGIAHFRKAWRDTFEGAPSSCPLYQAVGESQFPPGISYFIPLFFDTMGSFFDYLNPQAALVTVGEIYQAAENFWKEVEAQYAQLQHDRQQPILKPLTLFLSVEQCFQNIRTLRTLEIRSNGTCKFPIERLSDLSLENRQDHPLRHLESYRLAHPEDRFLFLAETNSRQTVIQALFKEQGWVLTPCADFEDFVHSNLPLAIAVGKLNSGFRYKAGPWTVVPEAILYGQHIPQRRRRQSRTEGAGAFKHIFELQSGMAVVHHHYGVGRYEGLVHLQIGATETDYLAIAYAGNDKIYVPVAALHLLHRYTGCQNEGIPLHKLGTDQWEKAKTQAAEKARDVAIELLEIYAKRENSQSTPLETPTSYAAFVAEFPFQETPDQLLAIEATLADLQKTTPMDRLICGDVGFGKTEVAMRAAFVAIQQGKQVAILVPTTLLAQQHFENFRDRFSNWPIQVAVLSRFETGKGTQATLAGLEKGTVDLVIGTHKLIQSDVRFHALGLVIIDEEHRFGVRQKEALRALRANVHVLALTATPIPRTLNMALAGIRDMSIITTPPARRLSIKTFIRPHQEGLIREAIMREFMRGGQVYYLYNDVETMERTVETIRALVPELRVEMAHGQMPARTLEHVMSDFYHQRFQVLVCTTIIETGIDIPSANTIIIERADKFGLAQLHQLRGRVGRSHHQAYAYCLTPPPSLMSAEAVQRLDALGSLEDLGSGFNIATHDLEIRGAGEFLGEDQSGDIQSVGYDLYMKLLQRAVSALQKGATTDSTIPLYVGAEIELQIPAFIPDNYVEDITLRLALYQRIAAASEAKLPLLKMEVQDRFGPLPTALNHLFRIMYFKHRAQALGIDKIEVGPTRGLVRFGPTPAVNFAQILHLIQGAPKIYQLKGPHQLQFQADMRDIEQRYQRLTELLEVLSPKE